MIKYKANLSYPRGVIESVEVERETEHMIITKTRREHKDCSYHKYFDSWEDAKEFLIEGAKNQLENARVTLQNAQGFLGNVKGLKNDN